MGANAVVILFTMDGCPACADYAPKFDRIAAAYEASGVPVYRYDADDERPDVQHLVKRLNVQATPTTFVLRRGPGEIRQEGDLEEYEIRELFEVARRLNGIGAP